MKEDIFVDDLLKFLDEFINNFSALDIRVDKGALVENFVLNRLKCIVGDKSHFVHPRLFTRYRCRSDKEFHRRKNGR